MAVVDLIDEVTEVMLDDRTVDMADIVAEVADDVDEAMSWRGRGRRSLSGDSRSFRPLDHYVVEEYSSRSSRERAELIRAAVDEQAPRVATWKAKYPSPSNAGDDYDLGRLVESAIRIGGSAGRSVWRGDWRKSLSPSSLSPFGDETKGRMRWDETRRDETRRGNGGEARLDGCGRVDALPTPASGPCWMEESGVCVPPLSLLRRPVRSSLGRLGPNQAEF